MLQLHECTGARIELRSVPGKQNGDEAVLTGQFPYGQSTVIGVLKEEIAPRAFRRRIDDPKADIRLLAYHDPNRPLATRATRTLDLDDDADGLRFTARISTITSWARDVIGAVQSGLLTGLSPGFRVVSQRYTTTNYRVITAADLIELSIVGSPAYEATVAAQAFRAGKIPPTSESYWWRR